MTFSAKQIAQLINGTIEGNDEAVVDSFGKIEEAKPNQLTFLANPKYEDFLYQSQAAIAIVNHDLVLKTSVVPTLIRVENAYTAFASLLSYYQKVQQNNYAGIEAGSFIADDVSYGTDVYIGFSAYIGKGAVIGNHVKIYPHCFIGAGVTIGDNCTIYSGVKIYDNCVLHNNITIHAGTVIGADGFGFAPQANGSYQKVPQLGNVIIEDDVEIGANTTVDRATIGSTIIKKGVKLDNLLQIAHNVEVGENTVIAAQAGISGSTKLGKNVVVGGQAGLVGHIQIADGVKINAQSGVSKSITQPNAAVTGTPAHDYMATLRSQNLTRKLPDMERRIKDLENIINQLTNQAK